MKVVVVVITGIDGCGKTTGIEWVKKFLEQTGLDVGYIRLPDFNGVPWIRLAGGVIDRIWRWADAHRFKPLICILGLLAVGLYVPALFQMRHKEVVLVEHSPVIDLVPYTKVYAPYHI